MTECLKQRMLTAAFLLLPMSLLAQSGQSTPPAPAIAADPLPSAASSVSALMVEVTIARYQGEKLLSSVPYTLAATPDNIANSLRVGGEMAVPSIVVKASDAADVKAAQTGGITYRSIGTNIDVRAAQLPASAGAQPSPQEARYRLTIVVEESSVYPPGEAAKNNLFISNAPAFRSLRSTNRVVLRHGQTLIYTAATDRITGETAKISVKLTVVP